MLNQPYKFQASSMQTMEVIGQQVKEYIVMMSHTEESINKVTLIIDASRYKACMKVVYSKQPNKSLKLLQDIHIIFSNYAAIHKTKLIYSCQTFRESTM